VKILKVIDRRPLADAFTSLLGGAIPGGAGNMRADGFAALRRMLEGEIAALEQATAQLESAEQNVTARQSRIEEERGELRTDLDQWQADSAAAQQTAGVFEQRHKRLAGELAATLKAIGTLGRELTAGMDRLTAEIDRRTPSPVRGGSLPQPAPAR
jgi:chromosome segregation ATPase